MPSLRGMTETAAICLGAPGRARTPTPIRSGFPKSCCNRRRSRRSNPISRLFWRAGQMSGFWQMPDSQEVMRAWAGLGYYSRARNLHACAKIVARDVQGAHFPRPKRRCGSCPGLVLIRRRPSRRSPSGNAPPRSTAMSHASSPGSLRSRRRFPPRRQRSRQGPTLWCRLSGLAISRKP